MHPAELGLPYDSYRPVQEHALAWAQQTDKRILLLEAPPGVGKSLIGAAWGRLFAGQRGAILTRTLSLLGQYERTIGLPAIRGAGNFTCQTWSNRLGRRITCEQAGDRCAFDKTRDCPYWKQRLEGAQAAQSVVSYAYALSSWQWRQELHYLVCDEGHNVIDQLTEWQAIRLPLELDPPEDLSILAVWARGKFGAWNAQKPADDQLEKLVIWKKAMGNLERACRIKADDLYVMSRSKTSLVLSPVWPKPQYLWQYRNLLMSATLYGGGLLADLFDLAPGTWDYLAVPSPFSVSRRPCYIAAFVPMNKDAGDDAFRQMASNIAWVMAKYPGEKGLIHVSSYSQVQRLQKYLADDGLPIIYHYNATRDKRAALFNRFRHTPGAWLLSPSAGEGEDFPYEAARVNVIAKVPYPDLGDPIMKARRADGKLGATFYSALACARVAQAYGRSMRAEDDWGHTWILDAAFWNLLKFNRELLPNYLREAIIRV